MKTQNQKLAKVEVASKELANTTVTITYKIVITNEGEKAAKGDSIYRYYIKNEEELKKQI